VEVKGVVLSAGLGSRFGSYTKEEHKLLLSVNERPVIDYMISQGGILKSCDIADCYWHDVDTLEDLQYLQTRFVHSDE
jgi:choline kinase